VPPPLGLLTRHGRIPFSSSLSSANLTRSLAVAGSRRLHEGCQPFFKPWDPVMLSGIGTKPDLTLILMPLQEPCLFAFSPSALVLLAGPNFDGEGRGGYDPGLKWLQLLEFWNFRYGMGAGFCAGRELRRAGNTCRDPRSLIRSYLPVPPLIPQMSHPS
jgi:hypothetical protein